MGRARFFYHQQTKQYAQAQIGNVKKYGNLKKQHLEQLNNVEHSDLKDSGFVSSGCSLVWLGLQLPKLITRVQIPATALTILKRSLNRF